MITALPCRGLDVLVADDDATLRMLFAELLRELGHRVATAGDGAEAVRQARRVRPDLVLIDYEMPVMDGLAAAREIRSLPGSRATIVMISSRGDADTRAAAEAAGIDRHLTKPVSAGRLRDLVGTVAATGSPTG